MQHQIIIIKNLFHDEETERDQADEELGRIINTEIENREDSDSELGEKIDKEIQDRQGSDAELDEKIDQIKQDIENSLINYATKDDLSNIPKFAIEVVQSLPTENISNTTVYLLPGNGDAGNLYTEYIYVNNIWEILGSQKFDLTGYATEDWVRGILQDYALTSDVYTKRESDSKFATKEELSTKADTSDVYSKSETDSKFLEKDSVYTKEEIESKLNDKANSLDVYSKSETDEKFVLKGESGDNFDSSKYYIKQEIDTRFLGKKYNILFEGDYNVNQSTTGKLSLLPELDIVGDSGLINVDFPIVQCDATIVPNPGYRRGKATVTKDDNTFHIYVSSATEIQRLNVSEIWFNISPDNNTVTGERPTQFFAKNNSDDFVPYFTYIDEDPLSPIKKYFPQIQYDKNSSCIRMEINDQDYTREEVQISVKKDNSYMFRVFFPEIQSVYNPPNSGSWGNMEFVTVNIFDYVSSSQTKENIVSFPILQYQRYQTGSTPCTMVVGQYFKLFGDGWYYFDIYEILNNIGFIFQDGHSLLIQFLIG